MGPLVTMEVGFGKLVSVGHQALLRLDIMSSRQLKDKIGGEMMENIVVGIISFLIGIIVATCSRTIAAAMIKQQNRAWGSWFGDKTIKNTRLMLIIFGGLFSIFGILLLGGFIKLH
jgi:hypothetical protein